MASPIMRHFTFGHLPPHLAAVSMAAASLAKEIDENLPDCAEKSAGLRKLLEAKDCFVRAAIEANHPAESQAAGIEKDASSQIDKE
jgi:hypothetical protein